MSKPPLLTYKLCIVSSVKNNPLKEKYNEKDNKNNENFIINKL
jgi:hypothetical protein